MNIRSVLTTKNVLIATATITVVGLAAYFGRGYIGFGKKDETAPGTITVETPAAEVTVEQTTVSAPEAQG